MSGTTKKKPSHVQTFVASAPRLKGSAKLHKADFKELRKRMEVGSSIQSEVFSIRGNSFALLVYPNGARGGEEGSLGKRRCLAIKQKQS